MSGAAPPPASTSRTVPAADGVPLHVLHWDAGAARARLLVVHGLGEHGGRYAPLAADLAGRGVSVSAMDLRGHGRSGGQRGHASRFEALLDDVERVRREAAAAGPAGVPLFLLGHSMGGLVALRYLQEYPEHGFRGAIFSAPLLGLALKPARWKVAASGLLTRIAPRLPMNSEIRPEDLSSDPAYVRSYREDPLVHTRITPRLYTEFMAHIGHAVDRRDRLPRPLLFLAPTADAIVDAGAVRRFAESLPGDVTLRRYEGFRHEPLNELDRHLAVNDVAAWIDAVVR